MKIKNMMTSPYAFCHL